MQTPIWKDKRIRRHIVTVEFCKVTNQLIAQGGADAWATMLPILGVNRRSMPPWLVLGSEHEIVRSGLDNNERGGYR